MGPVALEGFIMACLERHSRSRNCRMPNILQRFEYFVKKNTNSIFR
jgi:hypothetical protein